MQFRVAYLDETVILSKSPEQHIDHIRKVLTLGKEAGVTLKLKQCRFFTEIFDYSRHVIRPGNLEIASHATDTIWRLQSPANMTEFRWFLGLWDVFRQSVLIVSKLALPLEGDYEKANERSATLSMTKTLSRWVHWNKNCCRRQRWHDRTDPIIYIWTWMFFWQSWICALATAKELNNLASLLLIKVSSRRRTPIQWNGTKMPSHCMVCTAITSISGRSQTYHKYGSRRTDVDPVSDEKYSQIHTLASTTPKIYVWRSL